MSRLALILFCFWSVLQLPAQARPAASSLLDEGRPTESSVYLKPVETIEVRSEPGTVFADPLKCDRDGNLFFQPNVFPHEEIHSLNAKGQPLASFRPRAIPELSLDGIGAYAIGPRGELYQIVFPHEIARSVAVFTADGKYKSAIKLKLRFEFTPGPLGVFPSGDILVSGLRWRGKDVAREPFTGIFSPDGTLVKEVKFEDDQELREMAARGDSRVTSPENPTGNRAVSFSQMETGDDGNVYLMRWTNPAIFYAISPTGEVSRRFTVDPGEPGLRPMEMHISGNRIAVVFSDFEQEETVEDSRLAVVDLEGREIATYRGLQSTSKTKLHMSQFACYSADPERFTFFAEDKNLQLVVAQPR